MNTLRRTSLTLVLVLSGLAVANLTLADRHYEKNARAILAEFESLLAMLAALNAVAFGSLALKR